jgi:lipopolysaccharide transport system permease protein
LLKLAVTAVRYRELLSAFVGRELKARYRGSLLGGFWLVLQPLIFLAVYYLIFVEIMQANAFTAADLPEKGRTALQQFYFDRRNQVYALSMFVAMIPWQGLQECVSRAATTVGEHGNLIKKISFPSELLPIYLVIYNLINVVIGLVVYVVSMKLVLGIWPPAPEYLWLLPVALLLQGVFMLGLSLLLAATTVFLRDLVQLVPMAMTIWFFLSPIVYVRTPKPEFQWILDWNPAAYLIELYRTALIFPPGTLPGTSGGPWRALGIFAACAIGVLALGLAVFRKKKYDFADEL